MKIIEIEVLSMQLNKKIYNEQTIVHCHGVFDLLHIGHIKYFQEAKSMGDVLVVTITQDRFVNKGPGRPAFNEKLNGIASSANNYTLPEASASTKGGVELFSDTDQSVAAESVSTTANRTYGLQLNSSDQGVVNVPWTDTNTRRQT